jgi:hypothetical protein
MIILSTSVCGYIPKHPEGPDIPCDTASRLFSVREAARPRLMRGAGSSIPQHPQRRLPHYVVRISTSA